MFDDSGANYEIIVSASGFTPAAINRVKHLDKIRLETISWEAAYEKATDALVPNYWTDLCGQCTNRKDYGRAVLGLILWERDWHIVIEGFYYLFGVGYCLKCSANYLWCGSCGAVQMIQNRDFRCQSCGMDYNSVKLHKLSHFYEDRDEPAGSQTHRFSYSAPSCQQGNLPLEGLLMPMRRRI